MKWINIYTWLTSLSFSNFSKPFKDNEVLYKQARSFWNQLDQSSLLFLLIGLAIALIVVIYYYTTFNNYTGRRYKPKYWWLSMLVAGIAVLAITLGVEVSLAPPRLQGAFIVELKIALVNAFYGLLLFFVTSFCWCNSPLPTNAYRYLKIKKS